MPVRLYLTNATAGYTPPTKRGAWDASSATSIRQLGPRPSGTAATLTQAEASATNLFDVLLGRWISDPAVTAGTISGTLSFGLGRRESNAAANAVTHLHVFVTAGDTDTVRGTLLANWVGSTEWPTTAAAAEVVTGITLTSVALSVGDRIVVEIGWQAQNTSTTSYSGIVNFGNAGTVDVTNGSTAVTTQPGWVELSSADLILNPLTSSVVDTFATGTLAVPPWGESYGGADIDTGRARIPAAHTGGVPDYAGIETAASYRFDSAYCKLDPAPANGASVTCFSGLAIVDIASTPEGTSLHARHDAVTGKLRLESNVEYFDATATEITYNATDHAWLRIARSGTDIVWQTAPDGTAWTTRRTLAAPSWTNYGGLVLLVEAARDGGTNNYAYVDAVNTAAATEVTAAATLTAATSLTAAGAATTTGAATLSATTGVTAAATATTTGAATLGATTGLTAAATPIRVAAATLGAAASLTAAATPTRVAAAALTATTAVTAATTPIRPASATLGASATLTAAATGTAFVSATLAAEASVDASTAGTTGGQADLAAATRLTAAGTPTRPAVTALAAATALAADSLATTTASAALAAVTLLTGQATPDRPSSVALGAVTGLTAGATPVRPAVVALEAAAVLVGDASVTAFGATALGASTVLTTQTSAEATGAATLDAATSLDATGTPARPAAAHLDAATGLTAATIRTASTAATLTAGASLVAAPAEAPTAHLTATTNLTAGATATLAAAVAMTARTVVVAGGTVPEAALRVLGRNTAGSDTSRSQAGGRPATHNAAAARSGRSRNTATTARNKAGSR